MRRKNKIVLSSLGLLLAIGAPASIIIASNLSGGVEGKTIVGEGSSSVVPIVDLLTIESIYDVEYKASGSGEGIKSQSDNSPSRSFGMTSSLKFPTSTTEIDNWKNNKIRTVTFAIDAIGIVLNLPNGISYPNGIRPIINIFELSKIYDESLETNTTWGNLLENEPNDSDPLSLNSFVTPFGRQGGKSKSGTADGFWHTLKSYMYEESKPDYDHKNLSNLTPESNSQALSILKNANSGVAYISLGYALLNEDKNSIVASIQVNDSLWDPTIENVKIGSYKWTRPFNIIYSTNNNDSIEFVNFLLSPEAQKLVDQSSFVSLTKDQISFQEPLNSSDLERGAQIEKGIGMGIEI